MPATPNRRPRQPGPIRRSAPPRAPQRARPELLYLLAGALALSLLVAWILQFPTHWTDQHPGTATFFAFWNTALALATAGTAVSQGYAPAIAFGATAPIVLGAAFVWWAQASYRATLDGTPGYTLPHRPMAYEDAKDITLTTTDGVELKASYLGHGTGIGVVLVPGWATNRHGFAIATLAEWLAPRFDVVVLDQRGTGQSGGTLTPDLKARYDLLSAVAYLNAHGDNQVGVLAERESALPAMQAAGEQKSIRSLALASPPGHWGEAPLHASWIQDPANFLGRLWWRIGGGVRIAGGRGPDTAELITRTAGTPCLLLGSKDDPQGLLRQLNLLAPEPRSLRLFSGSGQPVAWSDYQSYYHTIAQWFALTLVESSGGATVEPGGTVPGQAPATESPGVPMSVPEASGAIATP